MITQCPHCQQLFPLSEELAEQAQYRVRCGRCMKPFKLDTEKPDLNNLTNHGETDTNKHSAIPPYLLKLASDESGSQPATQTPSHINPNDPNSMATTPDVTSPNTENHRIEPVMPFDTNNLDFDQEITLNGHHTSNLYSSAGNLHTWLTYCFGLPFAALLVFVLLLQLHMVTPQKSPNNVTATLCDILSCKGSTPNPFTTQHTNAIALAAKPPALLIEGILKNTSEVPLNYPPLLLTFRNNSDDIIAQRIFHPKEYLTKIPTQPTNVKAGGIFSIALEVVDPAGLAVNYQLIALTTS